MISTLLQKLAEKLINVATDEWSNEKSFQNTRLVIRDRLRREAKLNAELLSKMKSTSCIMNEISISALQQVFEMPLPLRQFMDNDINEAALNVLGKNKNFKRWTLNIKNEADLVERLWHRTRMLQIRCENNEGKPNFSYLATLNRALCKCLEEPHEV